ncbi:MAG: DUF1007 family protein [Kluyvera sp.]|uniref:DUF1007 family protein n=1 Tax=Kluyvera sp. TaxID=1538228 RepID=UPI003A871ADF
MKRVKQCAVVVFLALLSLSARAHPHSFITITNQLAVSDGQLTGMKMRWVMDELTSADLLYDAGNAKPGSEVWKKLAAEVMANVLGQHYFTEFWHNGKKVKFTHLPKDYALAREGHQAVLTFTLPLASPQPLAGQTYTFSTFDPTYYVDMSYEKDSDVAFAADFKGACSVSVHTPQPSEQMLSYAQSLDKEDAPEEDMELGKQFAQKVTVACQ